MTDPMRLFITNTLRLLGWDVVEFAESNQTVRLVLKRR